MERFTVGMTFGPSGQIHSLGLTKGDWREGSEFMYRAIPILAEFSERLADLYRSSYTLKNESLNPEDQAK